MNTVTTVCIIFATVFFCGAMGYLIVVLAHMNKLIIDTTKTVEDVNKRIQDINRIVDTVTEWAETTISRVRAFSKGMIEAAQIAESIKVFFHTISSSKGDTHAGK